MVVCASLASATPAPSECPECPASGMEAATAATTSAPATMPTTQSAITGSITVKIVQGTQDGPKAGNDKVTVELFRPRGRIETIEASLDDRQQAVVKNLSLAEPFRPRVSVQHAGVTYDSTGEIADCLHADQEIVVKVYESAAGPPAWEVQMRHVIVQPTPQGLSVTEMMAVHNAADRAWLGQADPNGAKRTLVLALPAGASEVQMSGALHSCCAEVRPGKIVSKAPLPPGTSQLRLSYVLPAPEGSARFELVAPAPVKNMMLFVPHQNVKFQAPGLQADDVYDIHGKPMQGYRAADLPAGRAIACVLEGLARAQSPAAIVSSPSSARWMVGIGAAVLVAAGLVIWRLRPRKA